MNQVMRDARPAPSPRSLDGTKILLAEDNATNRILGEAMLKKLGCHFDIAVNGKEALDMFEHSSFDLILMDLHMPVMNGHEASAIIRQREASKGADAHVPIIALTADVMEGTRQSCMEAGMDDYLSKPMTQDELATMLQRWLQERDAESNAANEETGSGLASRTDQKMNQVVRDARPDPVHDVHIDEERLSHQRELLGERFAELLRVYREGSTALLESMQTAIANNEPEDLRMAAHSLKSTSANLGAMALSRLAHDLEEQGRSGCMEDAETTLLKASTAFKKVEAFLNNSSHKHSA